MILILEPLILRKKWKNNKMSRQKIKAKRRVKCIFCDKEHRKGLAYYRGQDYFCSKNHWRKWKKQEEEKKHGKQETA